MKRPSRGARESATISRYWGCDRGTRKEISFIPAIASDGRGGLDPLIDEVATCTTEEAKEAAQYLTNERGLCVGISSGANYLAAKMMAERYGTAVTVFPDGLSKYRSQGLSRTAEGPCRFHKQCSCPIQDVCPRKQAEGECQVDDPEC